MEELQQQAEIKLYELVKLKRKLLPGYVQMGKNILNAKMDALLELTGEKTRDIANETQMDNDSVEDLSLSTPWHSNIDFSTIGKDLKELSVKIEFPDLSDDDDDDPVAC